MTEIICSSCGGFVPVTPEAATGERIVAPCPACGTEISYRLESPATTARIVDDPAATRPVVALADNGGDPHQTPIPAGSYSTLFYPETLGSSEDEAEPSDQASPAEADGTLLARPGGVVPPRLRLEGEAFFLVLGAEPGRERLSLTAARTVFGRAGADVKLDDPALSGRHFQVEVAGREFFIRDLESRNGTFVNGHRIRYAELRPGDEVLAGATYLVFRTSEDGVASGARPVPR